MEPIVKEEVEKYLYGVLPARDEVLREMERQATERDIPIVGPAVGRFLFQLALIAKAQTVFELGSAIGYSTIWWARAVGSGGRVIYTDSSEKNAAEAKKYFDRAGVTGQIEIRIGDALALLAKEQPESFDIIFNDVDKQYYPRVFELAAPRVKKGGLVVADNVLWSGRVAEQNPSDGSTKAIVEFNRLVYSDTRFFPTIMPLRDGVMIAQRRHD
jgi:predicted O-methyltransferase YrrM